MAKLNLEVSIPVAFLREGRDYIAYSPVLDLSTSGKSYEEAKERFSEAVQIFFEELVQKGTLDEVLSDLGWKKVKKQWSPPILVGQETESFRVPLSN